MLDYIQTDQHDRSKQALDLFTANLTGDLLDDGGDRACRVRGRRTSTASTRASSTPDPLRQTGEYQGVPSPRRCPASYNVNEVYG